MDLNGFLKKLERIRRDLVIGPRHTTEFTLPVHTRKGWERYLKNVKRERERIK